LLSPAFVVPIVRVTFLLLSIPALSAFLLAFGRRAVGLIWNFVMGLKVFATARTDFDCHENSPYEIAYGNWTAMAVIAVCPE
jgi:hypothetical protein